MDKYRCVGEDKKRSFLNSIRVSSERGGEYENQKSEIED